MLSVVVSLVPSRPPSRSDGWHVAFLLSPSLSLSSLSYPHSSFILPPLLLLPPPFLSLAISFYFICQCFSLLYCFLFRSFHCLNLNTFLLSFLPPGIALLLTGQAKRLNETAGAFSPGNKRQWSIGNNVTMRHVMQCSYNVMLRNSTLCNTLLLLRYVGRLLRCVMSRLCHSD